MACALDSPRGRALASIGKEPTRLETAQYKKTDPTWWLGADSLDRVRDDLKTNPELYNLDAVGYESVMLGFFTIWRERAKDRNSPMK